jgi:hypothetical protein
MHSPIGVFLVLLGRCLRVATSENFCSTHFANYQEIAVRGQMLHDMEQPRGSDETTCVRRIVLRSSF